MSCKAGRPVGMVAMLRLALLSVLALFTATSGVFQVRFSSGLTGVSSQTADPKAAILTPQEVFKRVSPSVFIVEALDSGGKVVAFGSGVAVAPDQIVTNHHVIERGFTIRVRRGQTKWPAKVTHDSADHDLCRLQVVGLKAAGLSVRKSSTLEVGERVYAIGAPERLELTFSEGVVSALRDFSDGRVIQTTAPISSGSSGGGLFDTQGRLVGITSAGIIEGQNLNFAVPGEWVLALEQSPALSSPMGLGSDVANQAFQWAFFCFDYGERQQYAKAVEACKKAILLKPEYVVAWYRLGVTYGFLGQHQQAIEAFKEAIRLKPDYADAWFDLGFTYGNLRQSQQAIEAFKEAIRLNPDEALAWNNLGVVYQDSGQWQQAIEACREAIRLKPEYANAWYNLGITYENLGKSQQALEAFKEAIRLKPDYAYAWNNLGIAYGQLEQWQQSLEAYKEAIRLKPDDARSWYAFGYTFLKLGQTQQAVSAYKEAVRLKPDDAKYWYGLGFAYAEQGNREKVMEVYQRLKALDSDMAQKFFNKFVLP